MHENKNIFFSIFWQKSGILILDLYLYGIKIQINIKQNSIQKYTGKSQNFKNIFLNFFGLGLTRPNHFGMGRRYSAQKIDSLSTVHFAEQWRSRGRKRRRRRRRRLTLRWGAVIHGGRSGLQQQRERDQRDITVLIFFSVYLLFFSFPFSFVLHFLLSVFLLCFLAMTVLLVAHGASGGGKLGRVVWPVILLPFSAFFVFLLRSISYLLLLFSLFLYSKNFSSL